MADEHGPYMDASYLDDTEFGYIHGVIRFEPGTVAGGGAFLTGGPKIHANSAHIASGLVSVLVDANGRLVINTDSSGYGWMGAIVAEEDETLSARDVVAGPSGGNGLIRCKFTQNGTYLDLTQQADWNVVAGVESNLWILGRYVKHRGVGLPSKGQQALDRIAVLEEQVQQLLAAQALRPKEA